MSLTLKDPSYYASQSGSLINVTVTGIAAIISLACAVQVYFIFTYKLDYLGGVIGLVHANSDGIAMLKFYLLIGAITFSIASFKFIKLTAAGLFIYIMVGLYGSDFYLKNQQNFSIDDLPKVGSSTISNGAEGCKIVTENNRKTIQCNHSNTYTSSDSPNKIYTADKKAVEQFAVEKGYTKLIAITPKGQHWCKTHKDDDEQSKINCYTGFIWRKL